MVRKKVNSYKEWLKKGVPAILIPGIIFATMYGTGKIETIKDYYGDKNIFPNMGWMEEVEDGDTIRLQSGQTVRLIGINAPDRGRPGQMEAKEELEKMVKDNRLWLEYDRYQDDKYGRILAWVWINCEGNEVKFTPADYMHLDGKTSRDYLTNNPEGCSQGKLVNREMVLKNNAAVVEYEKRGRLKYDLSKY